MLEQQLSIESTRSNLGVGEVFQVNIFHQVSREDTDPNAVRLTVRFFYNDAELELNDISYPDPRFTERFAIPGTDGANDDGIDETNRRQTLIFQGADVESPFPPERTLILQITFTTLAGFDGTQLSASIPAFENSLETITIDAQATNEPPVANNDQYSVNEDESLSGNVIAGDQGEGVDTDVDGDTLTILSNTNPENGTVEIDESGNFTYTPNADFNGTDSFDYTISDGNGGSSTATVTIIVDGVDPFPIANDDEYTVDEDQTLTVEANGVLGNDEDIDGDTSIPVLTIEPENGNVILNEDGSFSYTPDENFNGTDSFTYQVNDGELNSNPATVTITVIPVNDPPIANDDQYSVNEDESVSGNVISGNQGSGLDTDVDGDPLTIVNNTNPENGSIEIDGSGNFTYTPNTNFNGTDSFDYTISDGNGGTSIATVTINVNPVNDAPIASDDEYSVNEDETLTIPASGVLGDDSDIDGDALTSILVDGPSNGSLTLNDDGSFSYTPDANFNGTDSFTYQANDGEADSNTATVIIDVVSVNDAPVLNQPINNQRTTVGTPFNFTLPENTFSDVDDNSLTYNATLSNGNALPDWLDFNPETATFSGTASQDNLGKILVKVIASDSLNQTVEDDFALTVFNQITEGTNGNDTTEGTDGDDYLTGGRTGRDNLSGGDGDDEIVGGVGGDILTGGSGGDTFTYQSIRERGDRLTDFNVDEDVLDMSGLLDEFNYQGSDAIADGYISWRGFGSNTIVSVDRDGITGRSRSVPYILLLDVDASTVTADNFIL